MAAATGARRHNWQVHLSPEELELMEAVRAADAVGPSWVRSRADWLVRLVALEGDRLLENGAGGWARLRLEAALEALDQQQGADSPARGGRPPFVQPPRKTKRTEADAGLPTAGRDS